MKSITGLFNFAVIVGALGYFVDLYDLVLFGVVREASLKDLGISGDQDLMHIGHMLLNYQMGGMLVGGILWGILGDRKGRLKVLFGSIFLYSAANVANGFVTDINMYALLRFIAGIGLAGELGAGITLISETMPKEKRGYGTMMVVVFGALGAVLAGQIGGSFHWRTAYFIGGGLGFLLLLLRVGSYESGMYEEVKGTEVKRGAFLSLFTDKQRFLRYLRCILIGLPVWFTIGILIFNAPLFAKQAGITGKVVTGTAIMYSYIGLSVGDLICGILSQILKSRKKTILIYLGTSLLSFILFLVNRQDNVAYFYFLNFVLGAATGYWGIFVTIAAEQFGTNIRSTVTTTVPNFVRGAVVLITLSFEGVEHLLSPGKPEDGAIGGAIIVGSVCLLLAFLAIRKTEESFHKDLNYVEELS